MIPILVKPKLYSFKNRWKNNKALPGQIGRDFVIAVFSAAVMFGIYFGCHAMLENIRRHADSVYLSPSFPLGLLLMMLFMMLLFTNSIHALSSLFLGEDLELILTSPISSARFYWGKFSEILTSSSWMAAVFGAPAVIAFGTAYDAPAAYYFISLLVLIPFFMIPVALSLIAVTLFTSIVPVSRTREVLMVVGLIALSGAYFLFSSISPGKASIQDIQDVLRIAAIISLPNTDWLPSFWSAHILGAVLDGAYEAIDQHLILLYTTCGALLSLSYVVTSKMHYHSYSLARSTRHGLRLQSRSSHGRMVKLTPFLHQPYRAIVAKEFKLFARDMSQAVQLMLLLGLCVIYLYNFRVLHGTQGLRDETRLWWQGFLVIANIAMGGFVITAVSTRFVYPSVSLEGKSFWIMQTAPVSTRDILKAKFWCWLLPVASISSVIFASGAFAIDAEPQIVALNALASWVLCYGIVGLAVGFGALFSQFEWEHPSQLSASFGSLVFMLFSTALILLNMIPASVLIFLRTMRAIGYNFSHFDWYLSVSFCALMLTYLNYKATDWALKIGENALMERFKKS